MSKKKIKKNKKNKNPLQETIFGFPKPLIMKQPLIGDDRRFTCKKCGLDHVLRDGSDEFPETKTGEVMVYHCGDQLYVGGIMGHNVVGLEMMLAPYYQMVFLLSDMINVLAPIASMANHMEELAASQGLILKGNEKIPVTIPLNVTRKIRYCVFMGDVLLQKINFIKNVQTEPIELITEVNPVESLIVPAS